jgi:hypothetical protein
LGSNQLQPPLQPIKVAAGGTAVVCSRAGQGAGRQPKPVGTLAVAAAAEAAGG